ncbi:glycosyltransferase family 87 protein [Hymenobacter sp.]|jgi:hypothetical protein|uniref:glycosyltransferase family 87 protein n=1 Tax=Hymenobacter sp. TaxID=1898978 RepID=UPI002EDA7D91
MPAIRYPRFLFTPRFVAILFIGLTLIITTQHYLKGLNSYNNYLIFARPFSNLLAGNNLYLEYPKLYYDTYKYSPTFALFMGVFAVLPDWLGLLGWNLLNTVVFYTAGRRLFPDPRRGLVFLLLLVVDMMTALHNSQANCLLVGLMLWVYINLEEGKPGWAGLCVALAFFIKIYGAGIGLLFLLYPAYTVRGILWGALYGVLLGVAPLLVTSWPNFLMQYKGWFDIVQASATAAQFSIMGWLTSWFHLDVRKGPIQAAGLALLLLPLILYWRRRTEAEFRGLYLALIPIFVVVFNQMAESPTFVIPVAGFLFWWLQYRRSTPVAPALFVLVLLFTMLISTDIYPHFLRSGFFNTYKIKVVPMILAWALLQVQLLGYSVWQPRLTAARQTAEATPIAMRA